MSITCRNCKNFRPRGDIRSMETAAQLTPDSSKSSGVCTITNLSRLDSDRCVIDSFSRKAKKA